MTDLLEVYSSPIGFTEKALGLSLYNWQDKALAPLELATGPNPKRIKISVVAPNGSGKSERVIAPAGLWWATVHKRGRGVFTSKDSKQLNEQIVPAVEKHLSKLQGWKSVDSPYFKVTTPTGATLHYFVTDEAFRLEGWHKEDDLDGPLLMGLDEAKSIKNDMFEAVDRCTWNALLYTSSGGLMHGRFFDSQTKHAGTFITVQAGLVDCPHIPKDKIEDIIRTYGEDHPFTRSTLYGEFMDQSDIDSYIVPLSSYNRCIDNPPPHRPGFIHCFCDFGDNNAICLRNGNKYTIEAFWKDSDKMRNVGRFIQHFRRLNLKEDQITGDASDAEMLKLLAEAGWKIGRQNFGAEANEKEVYQSWSAEAWINGAIAIEKCDCILPDDPDLKAQVTTRKKEITSRGKIGIEEKYQMQKRGIGSPHKADVIFGAMAKKDYSNSAWNRFAKYTGQRPDWNRSDQDRQLEEIGANPGL